VNEIQEDRGARGGGRPQRTRGRQDDGKTYTPPEISAMILQKMKQTAEDIWATP
jgi:molecular chaperone DnaK (HSP70)